MLHKWWECRLLFLSAKLLKFEIQRCGQILCAHKPYFLMPGHKYRSYFKALLGLAKVVIVLVILFGSYASLPGNQTFGWPQSILYGLDFQY